LGAIALVLSFASGSAALLHQIVWIRRMVDALGATADTFAGVTGAFFLGLALGGWLSTRTNPANAAALWRSVAIAEALVGLLAVSVLFSDRLVPAIAAIAIPGGVLRMVMPALLIAPPAIAMGVVTPWMIRAVASATGRTLAVPIYTANTVGGMLGIVAALAVLLPTFGTVRAGLLAVGLNLTVALACGAIGARRGTAGKMETAVPPQANPPPSAVATAFGSGFLVLASETILQLQFTQVTVNSHFSAGFVLLLVLGGLSIGAMISGFWARTWKGQALGAAIAAALAGCVLQVALFHVSFRGLTYQPYQVGTAQYFRQILVPGLLCGVLPMALAGLVFPQLIRAVQHTGPTAIGRALAWNGLGGWLGAECAQGLLLPRLGLWGAMCAMGAGYALLIGTAGKSRRSWWVAATGFAASAASWVFFSGLPHVRPADGDHLRAFSIGREGIVAVVEGGPGDLRIVFNNSYTLGGTRAATNQERQAHLPILLHGNARSVATLGLATGSTASGALAHPDIERLDVIELSGLVIRYAGRYFAPFNHDLLADPRVHAIQADARWEILRKPANYDVIVGDLFLPWRTGEGRLYSREHFSAVRRALNPRGLICQWLPMYQLTHEQFAAIARTFQSVFPDAFLVRGDFYAGQTVLGLVGGRDLQSLDWESIRLSADKLRTGGRSVDPIVRHPEGVAMMIVGPLPAMPAGPVVSLDNAWLEWNAGHHIVAGGEPWFTGIPLATFVRDIQRSAKPLIPGTFATAHEAGQFFLTLEIAHEAKARTAELAARGMEFLPASLRTDRNADWRHWPMLHRIEIQRQVGLPENRDPGEPAVTR
jgi:spermidine synthase